jgi:hypothetical protein
MNPAQELDHLVNPGSACPHSGMTLMTPHVPQAITVQVGRFLRPVISVLPGLSLDQQAKTVTEHSLSIASHVHNLAYLVGSNGTSQMTLAPDRDASWLLLSRPQLFLYLVLLVPILLSRSKTR